MQLCAANVLRRGGLRAGERLLLLADEMSSGCLAWQYACEAVGAHLKIICRPGNGVEVNWADEVVSALADPAVAVVAVPNVHWVGIHMIFRFVNSFISVYMNRLMVA